MATGNFALGDNVFSVDEGAKSVKVTIVRTDGAKGSGKVDYTTYNDSADNGSDYKGKTGTVTFKSGQTEKTVKIAITQDDRAEGTEKFFSIFWASVTRRTKPICWPRGRPLFRSWMTMHPIPNRARASRALSIRARFPRRLLLRG